MTKTAAVSRTDAGGPGVSPAGGPSLDIPETSVPTPPPSTYRNFLTSGCLPDVQYNQAVYEHLDDRDGHQRTSNYTGCRTSAWFVRHKQTGEVRVSASACRLRWCPLCIKTKRFTMVQSIVPWLHKAKKPKFITLTLAHSDADLQFQIDSLYKFFRNLRRRPEFSKPVKGGVWFFQIKKSSKDGRWHPHLHMLVEGAYLPQSDLSAMWADITHGSRIVDIRAVKNVKKAADYVARYASAPCRLADLEFKDAVEVVDSLHGRRVCGTWGTGKEIKLTVPKCDDADQWEYLDSFASVLRDRHRVEWAAEIYRAWIKDDVCYAVPDPPPTGRVVPLVDPEEIPVTFRQLTFEWGLK